jgi:hypothetical protein
MTAREAVEHLRTAALKMAGKDAEAIAVTLDHLRQVEQTLELLLNASDAALNRAPKPAIVDHSWKKPERLSPAL